MVVTEALNAPSKDYRHELSILIKSMYTKGNMLQNLLPITVFKHLYKNEIETFSLQQRRPQFLANILGNCAFSVLMGFIIGDFKFTLCILYKNMGSFETICLPFI